MAGKIQHESAFRAYLAEQRHPAGERRIADDGVDSYVIYLEAVSRGIGVPISPDLMLFRGDDDILADAKRKPLQSGKMPSPSYVDKWEVALGHYREMCKQKGL